MTIFLSLMKISLEMIYCSNINLTEGIDLIRVEAVKNLQFVTIGVLFIGLNFKSQFVIGFMFFLMMRPDMNEMAIITT